MEPGLEEAPSREEVTNIVFFLSLGFLPRGHEPHLIKPSGFLLALSSAGSRNDFVRSGGSYSGILMKKSGVRCLLCSDLSTGSTFRPAYKLVWNVTCEAGSCFNPLSASLWIDRWSQVHKTKPLRLREGLHSWKDFELIYLSMYWVSAAAHRLSPVSVSGGSFLAAVHGFSLWRLPLLYSMGSRRRASSCGVWA